MTAISEIKLDPVSLADIVDEAVIPELTEIHVRIAKKISEILRGGRTEICSREFGCLRAFNEQVKFVVDRIGEKLPEGIIINRGKTNEGTRSSRKYKFVREAIDEESDKERLIEDLVKTGERFVVKKLDTSESSGRGRTESNNLAALNSRFSAIIGKTAVIIPEGSPLYDLVEGKIFYTIRPEKRKNYILAVILYGVKERPIRNVLRLPKIFHEESLRLEDDFASGLGGKKKKKTSDDLSPWHITI